MAKGKEFVNSLIESKKVVVFSKTYCPFCDKAKRALRKYDIAPEDIVIVEIEDRDDCDEIQNYLKDITGARSVPRVFINKKCIGGGDETASLDRSGKLKELLKEAKAIK